MSRRNYNKKTYSIFKKANKWFREKLSVDPLSKLKEYGVAGKIGNKVGNKLIEKPMHVLTYKTTGLFYDKKIDSPYKGSILYTIFKWSILILLGFVIPAIIKVISLLVGMR